MKILAALFAVILVLVVKDSITDIKLRDIDGYELLFPVIFILFAMIIAYLVLSA